MLDHAGVAHEQSGAPAELLSRGGVGPRLRVHGVEEHLAVSARLEQFQESRVDREHDVGVTGGQTVAVADGRLTGPGVTPPVVDRVEDEQVVRHAQGGLHEPWIGDPDDRRLVRVGAAPAWETASRRRTRRGDARRSLTRLPVRHVDGSGSAYA